MVLIFQVVIECCKNVCGTHGSLANASSVGAKTVNGPGPLSVGTRPAAVRAAASVLNDPAPTAVSTMSAMLMAILLARTGTRVDTKAFATTRVEAMSKVCIILQAYSGQIMHLLQVYWHHLLHQSSQMNVPK